MGDGKEPVRTILIAGPTASGKSALALALAERLGAEVINADSMQIYAALPLLTAQPTASDLGRALHRLYGLRPPDEPCSAARWAALARAAIIGAHAAGRLALVVGGTGLYFRALVEGLAEIPDIPAEIRAEAMARHARLGGDAFRAELAGQDPQLAARLAPGDTQRLIRGMEVFLATGRPLSDWQGAGRAGALDVPWRGLVMAPPREVLRARFLPRLQAMAEAGLVEEVRGFLASDPDPLLPLSRAVGMAPLRRHVGGEISLEAALALADIDTRHYAKRQLTWARKHMADWVWLKTAQQMESLIDQSLSFIQI